MARNVHSVGVVTHRLPRQFRIAANSEQQQILGTAEQHVILPRQEAKYFARTRVNGSRANSETSGTGNNEIKLRFGVKVTWPAILWQAGLVGPDQGA